MNIEPWTVEGISRATWYRRSRPEPEHVEPQRDPLRWYCVRTAFAGEQIADAEIWLAGFEGYWPTVWCPAEPARRLINGAMRPARPDRVVPMFRRYGFVRFRRADPWQRIRGLTGVDGILGTAADRPVAVPDAAMTKLRAICGGGDCEYPRGIDIHDLHAAIPFNAGARVRLIAGVLADPDRVGTCDWSDAIETRVVLSLLGRDVPVTVPRGWVEAA